MGAADAIEFEQTEDDFQARENIAIQLAGLGQKLQAQIDQLVIERKPIEDRMLRDLRQYNGIYDPEVLSKIKDAAGSEAFVNLSRAKTNTVIARLSDTLLPTDDHNWGIEATPIPELAEHAKSEVQIGQTPEGAPIQMRDMVKAIQDIGSERAKKMQTLMSDQLGECNYNAECREVIHDACVLGTGVLKGVQVAGKTRNSWQLVNGVRVLQQQTTIAPTALRVDPFDFYPDLSATSIEHAEFTFERHYISRKQLRRLTKQPGFLADQIKIILEGDSTSQEPSHLTERRSMQDANTIKSTRYQLWEYHGPVSTDDLAACGCEVGEDQDEVQACLWFCEGRVIKAALEPTDTDDLPYSVFTLETDGTSIFGYGIPHTMHHSQRVANSVWRACLDNVAWAVRGIHVFDVAAKAIVRTTDGLIRPGCEIEVDSSFSNGAAPYQRIQIDPHIDQLLALFNLANELIDQETQTPLVAQGEGSSYLNQTAQGTAMMLNAANTVLRRLVKRFDDQITKTFIRRLYDFNMQHHDDDSVKGDYDVIARGTSALLEKEQQTQGLMWLMQNAPGNPIVQQYLKPAELMDEMAKLMRLPKSTIKSAEEVRAEQANNPPQQDPKIAIEQQKLQLEQAKIEQAAQDSQNDLQRTMLTAQGLADRHNMQFQLAMAKLAEEKNMTVAQMQQELGIKRMELDNQNQLFNAEARLKMQTGQGI